MIKLSDELYIPGMGQVLADRAAAEKAAAKTLRRDYKAAKVTSSNVNWTQWPTGANWERRSSLAALRGRARQASRDDPYISKYLKIMRSSIVGPQGIQL